MKHWLVRIENIAMFPENHILHEFLIVSTKASLDEVEEVEMTTTVLARFRPLSEFHAECIVESLREVQQLLDNLHILGWSSDENFSLLYLEKFGLQLLKFPLADDFLRINALRLGAAHRLSAKLLRVTWYLRQCQMRSVT